jgi:putative flippase GtrA
MRHSTEIMATIKGTHKRSPVRALIRHRFVRFGVVGLSGTVVNMAVLYVSQTVFFADVFPFKNRLRISLCLAIFLATMNNYLWNRWWTWGDRKKKSISGFFTQMVQYYLACGIAIFLQFVITMLLSRVAHYLVANAAAIVLSAIFVYILNNVWTFRKLKIVD